MLFAHAIFKCVRFLLVFAAEAAIVCVLYLLELALPENSKDNVGRLSLLFDVKKWLIT